jgi:hypothetical protein
VRRRERRGVCLKVVAGVVEVVLGLRVLAEVVEAAVLTERAFCCFSQAACWSWMQVMRKCRSAMLDSRGFGQQAEEERVVMVQIWHIFGVLLEVGDLEFSVEEVASVELSGGVLKRYW